MITEPTELLALAVDVAAEAAALVQRMRAEGVDVAGTKSSPIDIVTKADQASEELIRTRLLGARPDDGFLGEEGDDVLGTSGVRWLVDPIDGTVNYLYGEREFAVSIAAQLVDGSDGRSVAGVVHAPAAGLVYTASEGGGAWLNGQPIHVRDVVEMSQRLITTGFNYRPEVKAAQISYVSAMLPQIRDIRRHGSSALDVCSVAAGVSDGYVEEGTFPWDDGASSLVATEAGATYQVLTSPSGNRLSVCAPRGGFAEFLELLDHCGFIGNTTPGPDVL